MSCHVETFARTQINSFQTSHPLIPPYVTIYYLSFAKKIRDFQKFRRKKDPSQRHFRQKFRLAPYVRQHTLPRTAFISMLTYAYYSRIIFGFWTVFRKRVFQNNPGAGGFSLKIECIFSLKYCEEF